jgi:hypothetical protein
MKIQRVPRGLNDLLSISGGNTPVDLQNEVRPVIDLLQFYGLNQITTLAQTQAALAEGGVVEIVVPSNQYWLLYAAHTSIVKTATMTALSASIQIGATPNFGVYDTRALGPFGATETGTARSCYPCPVPKLLLPGWSVRCGLDILGTDATANVSIVVHVGVLG